MKLSSVFVPVIFLLFLFVIVLPRLLRGQSAVLQILPPTSITPTAARPGVQAGLLTSGQPDLNEAAAPYLNGKSADAVVVSVKGRFSLPVVQQPKDQPAFVSSEAGVLTQFSLPRQYGVTGLLAHNFLSGKEFDEIQVGDVVSVVYGDGRSAAFQVEKIESYQALSPTSPYSRFIDLSSPESGSMTSASLFNRVYTHPSRVVFQTCIEANGESSWGRKFITAAPINQLSPIPTPDQILNNN